jgi:glycosyltransferase involved in cell wall biosynthesis
MFVRNALGRIVDIPETLEKSVAFRNDLKILSVSQTFWRTYPDLVARLKKMYPRLVTDDEFHYQVTEKNLMPDPRPVGKREASIGKRVNEIKVPKGKVHFVIYPNYLPKVGGIETAVYELANGLDKKKYFVTIAFYNYESEESMKRYASVANLVQLNGETLECDVCLITSNHLQPEEIKARKWIQWIHSDYEKYNNLQLVKNPDVTDYVAVSEHVAKISKKMFGIDCHVIYNLLDPNFGKGLEKPIRFVSNTRLSPEKGFNPKTDRMLRFARMLKKSGRNFTWTICGDNTHMKQEEENIKERFKEIEEVHFVGYKRDILPTLVGADYNVLLSDWEGCPYGVLESLQVGVPCIVTNWGGVEELIQDGVNGYVLPMSLKGVDMDKILNNIPKGFDTTPKSSIKQWEDLINKVKKCSKR